MNCKVHLIDHAEFVVEDFVIINSGWASFKKEGKKFLLPSHQIAIVETDYAPTFDRV